jgi:hypothetical protein
VIGQGQHLVPKPDRLARLVEAVGGQARHLDQARAAPVGRKIGQLFLVDVQQRAPRPAAGVKLLEPLAGLGVRRIRFQDLLEAGDRVVVLAQLLRPEGGDAPVQRQPLRGIGGRVGLAGEDLDEVAPAPLRLVAAGQRRQRRRVVRLERHDAEVGVDHHDVQVQAVAVDGDDLEVPVDLLVDVGGRDGLQILFQDLEQRVPLLRARVKPLERLDRLGQVRLQAQQALPDVDGLVDGLVRGLRALLGGARHLDAHRHAPLDVGLGLLRLRQQRQELRLLVPRGEVLAVEVDHRAVRRIQLAHAAEVDLRLARLIQPLPLQRRQVDGQRHVGLAALRAHGRLQHLGQLGPALLGGQRRDDRPQRAALDGVRLQRLAEVGQRGVGTAGLLRQLAGLHLGQRALLARRRLLGAAAIERQQIVQLAGVAQHAFQVQAGAPVARIQLQAAAQVALARCLAGACAAVLEVELRDRSEQAGRQRLVGRRLGLLQVPLRDRLPVALHQRHLRLRLQRRRVIGDGGQRRLHAGLPLAVAQQLVAEDAPLLVQKIGAARHVGGPGQLQIDQLHAQLEVAALAVPAARVGQRVGQRIAIDAAAVARVKGGKRLQRVAVVRIQLEGF